MLAIPSAVRYLTTDYLHGVRHAYAKRRGWGGSEFVYRAIGIVALLGSACAAPLSPSGPVVRDSAGVRIVEYASIADTTVRLDIAPAPWLELGSAPQGEFDAFDARQPFLSATVLSDGRIAVADFSDIKFFDSTGRYLGYAGRAGQGPGEFRHLGKLCRIRGDTLIAIDYQDRRITVWDGNGRLTGAYGDLGYLATDPCFPDGTLLVSQPATSSPDGQRLRDSAMVRYARVRLDGAHTADIGFFPEDEYGLVPREVSIIAASDRVYVGDAKTYEVRVQTLNGALIWVLRVLAPPVELTNEKWRAEIERRIPASTPPARREAQIQSRLSQARPKTYPAYRRVRVDPAGRLWIQDYHNVRLWTVFDSTGSLLGRLELDANQGRLADVGMNYVVLRGENSAGSPKLSFFRLANSG